MSDCQGRIAMMDTGVGGVYVLHRARLCMPGEHFSYLADLAHAPYGTKSPEEIRELTWNAAQILVSQGAKALFIACNTATAGAIDFLRKKLDIPVVGMEPAIKPALEQIPDGRIAVLATPATLALDKFRHLSHAQDGQHRLIPVPCPGLSRMIELQGPDSPMVAEYLHETAHLAGDVSAAVVGCTHYSYLHRQISEAFGGVPVFDGADGACRQMKKLLEERGILRNGTDGSAIMKTNSENPADQALLEQFYHLAEAEA